LVISRSTLSPKGIFMPTIEYRNDVAALPLRDGENRFSIDFMNSIHKYLDSLSPTASGLVTTGTGKFYSNGLSQASPEVDAFPQPSLGA